MVEPLGVVGELTPCAHGSGGLTHLEIAEALGLSAATVDRKLRIARLWLRRELERRRPE